MNIIKYSLCSVVLFLFAACCTKEAIPNGLVLSNAVIDVDTNYILPAIPATEQKRVFVEEFTGVACVNCPGGAAIIKAAQLANPNKILVAKVHSDFLATPLEAGDPDFRCDDAQALDVDIAKLAPKPSASFDRVLNTGNASYVFSLGFWNTQISNRLALATPLNLGLSILNYDAVSKEVKLKTQASFTSALNDNINYHIYVLENDVEAAQDSNSGIVLTNYVHEEILRDIITPVGSGSPWLQNVTKIAGLEAVKISTFILPNNVINPANCYILVAIQNDVTKEMIQVSEVKLQ